MGHHFITRLVSWVFSLRGNDGIQEVGSFRPRQKNFCLFYLVLRARKENPFGLRGWRLSPGGPCPETPPRVRQHPQSLRGTNRAHSASPEPLKEGSCEGNTPFQDAEAHQQQGTKSKLLSERQNCLQASPELDHWGWQGRARRGHPRCTQAFPAARTNAAAHIWAQQDSLQQTHFYCSRLFLRPRVLEMKGSLLWSWEIRESTGVLCLGGKACELRLVWMLMLA